MVAFSGADVSRRGVPAYSLGSGVIQPRHSHLRSLKCGKSWLERRLLIAMGKNLIAMGRN